MTQQNPLTFGERFGLLTTVSEAEKRGDHTMIECQCDCGNVATVRLSDLRRRTRSCGCTGGRPLTDDDRIDRGYPRAHAKVRVERGPASGQRCIDCGDPATAWTYVRGCPGERRGPLKPSDPASKLAPYCQHVEHYQPRCYSCHARLDGSAKMTARRARATMLNRL